MQEHIHLDFAIIQQHNHHLLHFYNIKAVYPLKPVLLPEEIRVDNNFDTII